MFEINKASVTPEVEVEEVLKSHTRKVFDLSRGEGRGGVLFEKLKLRKKFNSTE